MKVKSFLSGSSIYLQRPNFLLSNYFACYIGISAYFKCVNEATSSTFSPSDDSMAVPPVPWAGHSFLSFTP